MAYHAKGQYDLAIADYTQALAKDGNADAHYNRGLVYRDKGNLDDALADFEAAIRKKNDEPNYFVALGIVHYMKSAYDLSVRDLDKAIELAFKNTTMTPEGKAEYYFMRARAKAEAASAQLRQCRTFAGARCDSSEQFMAAAADFKLALAEKSDYVPALVQLGVLASEMGDRRQAIEHYSAAIKADPNETTAYNNRGVIYGTWARVNWHSPTTRADDSAPLMLPSGTAVHAGRDGVDSVEFGFAAHRGSDILPLNKSASGGELSRVMLALEVVLATSTEGTTMVFDEVDAGVGGRAAVQIGRRLARLARTHQVIVVTHLPQVAAYADVHLVVEGDVGGRSERAASSGVRRLDDDSRVAELARMLAGLGESDSGRAHARELLDAAQGDRRAGLLSCVTGVTQGN